MFPQWLVLLFIYVISEIVIAFMFSVLAQLLYKKIGFDFKSILKGIIERSFLVLSLFYGYHHGLTLFGALKLGTRLKRTDEIPDPNEKNFNDYYLLGNLISVAIAIGYVVVLKNIDQIPLFTLITK